MPSRLIQIVPHLPPTMSGVGDYAVLLAEELRRAHNVDTSFVIGNRDWNGPAAASGFRVRRLEARTAGSLVGALGEEPSAGASVLLQYSGYSFQKRGCPFWLVRGLEKWRRAGEGRWLATMFHELYASGPMWASSFWTSLLQRNLAARLAWLSDRCWTNRRRSADELGRLASRHQSLVEVMPVFSNFGEPKVSSPLRERPAQAVMFGTFGRAVRNPAQGQAATSRACRLLGVEKLVIVGGGEVQLNGGKLAIERVASLSAEQAAQLLGQSRAGLLDYFDGYLGKSGIFAAYCSHGLAPVLLAPNDSRADGVHAGEHFLVAELLAGELPVADQQRIADAARHWYSGHDLTRTAKAVATALRPES